MRKIIYLFLITVLVMSCSSEQNPVGISTNNVDTVINSLVEKYPQNKALIEKGVKQIARLWQATDGNETDFISFCEQNYIADEKLKETTFLKISDYLEAIYGHNNEITLQLQKNVQEATGALTNIDEMFSAYNPSTHLSDDLYNNKIAFVIALNYPEYSLEEKENFGNDRLQWAYSRLGDIFTSRIPAEIKQNYSKASNDADMYIADYNVYAGHLINKDGEKLFPENMILLSHWNLRDEIKANYSRGEKNFTKQLTIYEVMKNIITQDIPEVVINSGDYDWNPFTNEVFSNGEPITYNKENNKRYATLLNVFKALKAMDTYTGNTYINRKFNEEMEISLDVTEELLKQYVSAPELKLVAEKIKANLGRDLQAFDIWYDGFKPRSNLDEAKLSEQTRKLYPNAEAMEKDLPNMLIKLGFNKDRAKYLTDRIEVDAARGSGHAWGGVMKGQKAHLRTRIPEGGMDYKGYNIAVHEFGHNVEQTISLYDVDYYMLNGVPNTAFTEALAFAFQKRDLDILGIQNSNPEKDAMDILDKAWQLYEIAGVSLLDISVWKWLYANPDATPEQLKETTISLAKEIWNEYYAPIFGVKDEIVLGIYSHMLSYPLYLSAYSFGQIIEFQLEQYFNGRDFATEIDRIFRLGRLTPNQWMIQATGEPLSVEPLLKAVREIQ
ncbi:hypothetical protein M2138_001547 [Dysgonomonadaceae bacterium PH5-43]|nr:hypothetical protein [Dysgonomonadaceae bacterium PH5-43]